MDRTCENCQYFIPNAGRYSFGRCGSPISKKRNKSTLIKKDTCSSWEENSNGVKQKRFN